jgi:lipoate-protein ligase A
VTKSFSQINNKEAPSNAANTWRVIDTGLRRAAENIAINRAMLEAHQAGQIPHTLRFLQFQPSALIGYHQSVAQELREDYCQQQGIDIQRRITGGGAIYFDATQIGWELYVDKRFMGSADMGIIAKRICEAAAQGISALGVEARYRPRNDIEVNGKKISGTGGAFDGDSILYQGTLLIEFDIEKMLRVLHIPAEKLAGKAIASARERVTNLGDMLGKVPDMLQVKRCLTDAFQRALDVRFESEEALTATEQQLFTQALAEIDSPRWVYQFNRTSDEAPVREAIHRCAGGTLRACLHVDTVKQRIKQAWITGDFFVNPKRLVVDLEAALRNTAIDNVNNTIDNFFSRYDVEMLLLNKDDFAQVIQKALVLETRHESQSV